MAKRVEHMRVRKQVSSRGFFRFFRYSEATSQRVPLVAIGRCRSFVFSPPAVLWQDDVSFLFLPSFLFLLPSPLPILPVYKRWEKF